MRWALPALALGAAGCVATIDYSARSDLSVRASVHKPERLPLAMARVQVESRDGRVLLEGLTDEAGEAAFEVWWSEGPFAVTVTSPELDHPLTAVGLDEAHPHQDLWAWDPPEVEDTVLASGTATHRTPGSALLLVVHPGAHSFSTEDDDFVVKAPRAVPFTLVAMELDAYLEDGEWFYDVHTWTVAEFPGYPEDRAGLELDLSISPGEAQTGSIDVRWPEAGIADVRDANVEAGAAGPWSGTSTRWIDQSETETRVEMEWIRPWPEEDYRTLVAAWLEDSYDGATTQCAVEGTPDEVEGPVEMLPFPAFAARPSPSGPLGFTGVPEGITPMVWFQAAYTWERLWQVQWPTGQEDDLWLPASAALPALQGQVYAHPVLWEVPEPIDGRLLGCWAWADSTLVTRP